MTITVDTLKTCTRTGPALPQFAQQLATKRWNSALVHDCYVAASAGGKNLPVPAYHPESWQSAVLATNADGIVMVEFPHPKDFTCEHPAQFVGIPHKGGLHLFLTSCAEPDISLASQFATQSIITPTFMRLPFLPGGHLWTWCANPREVPDDFVSFTTAPFTHHETQDLQHVVQSASYYVLRPPLKIPTVTAQLALAAGVGILGAIKLFDLEETLFWFSYCVLGGVLVGPYLLDPIIRTLSRTAQTDLSMAIAQIKTLLVQHGGMMLIPELEDAMRTHCATLRHALAGTVPQALNELVELDEIRQDTRQFLDPQQQLVEVPYVELITPPGGGGRRRKRELAAPLLPDLAPVPARL